MTTQALTRQDLRRALVWGFALAVLWVVVALIWPTSTFHLAPFLIAAAPPTLFALDENNRTDWTTIFRLAGGGIAFALAATLVVSALGAMQGPAFEVFSGPFVEAAVFAVVGTVAGVGFAWWRMR